MSWGVDMFVWVILVCAAVFLQTTVFSWFKLWMIKPDLITIIVLYAALWKGPTRGAAVGFMGGIIEDIFSYVSSGAILGANAFAKVVTGFLFGLLRKRFSVNSVRFQIISSFAATLLSQMLFFFLSGICGMGRSANALGHVLFPVSVCNAVLAPFVFLLLKKVVKPKYDKAKPD